MIKLTAYSILCLTFSAYAMNFNDAFLSVCDNVAKQVNSETYKKLYNDGDILFVSSDQYRTDETSETYKKLYNDGDILFISPDQYRTDETIDTFLNNNQQSMPSEKEVYKTLIKNFIKTWEIIFFNIKGVYKNIPVNILAELRCRSMSASKSYEFALSINRVNSSDPHLPLFDLEKPLENISLMLFACIKNKESAENNTYVQAFIEDIKLLLNDSSKTIYKDTFNHGDGFISYGFQENAVLLRMVRNKDDKSNWNIFPINLFCKLIDFKNKFQTNN